MTNFFNKIILCIDRMYEFRKGKTYFATLMLSSSLGLPAITDIQFFQSIGSHELRKKSQFEQEQYPPDARFPQILYLHRFFRVLLCRFQNRFFRSLEI